MTVVAMWCRHAGDDLIGIGDNIPWNVPSDTKHFLDVVSGQTVVCGRITYESFPGRTIDGCKMLVLTSNQEYEVSDLAAHRVISGQRRWRGRNGHLRCRRSRSILSVYDGKGKAETADCRRLRV